MPGGEKNILRGKFSVYPVKIRMLFVRFVDIPVIVFKLSVFVHWCVSNVPFDQKIVVSSAFLQHVAIFVLQDAPILMQYILLDLRK